MANCTSYTWVFAVAARLPKTGEGMFLMWNLIDKIFCFRIWMENTSKSNDTSIDIPAGLLEKNCNCLKMDKKSATDKTEFLRLNIQVAGINHTKIICGYGLCP